MGVFFGGHLIFDLYWLTLTGIHVKDTRVILGFDLTNCLDLGSVGILKHRNSAFE